MDMERKKEVLSILSENKKKKKKKNTIYYDQIVNSCIVPRCARGNNEQREVTIFYTKNGIRLFDFTPVLREIDRA